MVLASLPGCAKDTGTCGVCDDPESVLDGLGNPTGFERCADGAVNRVSQESRTPDWSGDCRGDEDVLYCAQDSDCTEGDNGVCAHRLLSSGTSCECQYACLSDADCAPGEACVPGALLQSGEPWSQCIEARCLVDDDCALCGQCGVSSYWSGCGIVDTLACRDPTDTCHSEADCGDAWMEQCVFRVDDFVCREPGCAT